LNYLLIVALLETLYNAGFYERTMYEGEALLYQQMWTSATN